MAAHEVQLSFPFHLRYQLASSSLAYEQIGLALPQGAVLCDPSREASLSDFGSYAARLLTHGAAPAGEAAGAAASFSFTPLANDPTTPALKLAVPVGVMQHYEVVAFGTLAVTIGSAAVIIWTTLQPPRDNY